jgi:hypothetical protein
MSSSFPPFSCCRVSSIHLPSHWSTWSSLLLIIHLLLAMCPAPFHVSLSPKGEFVISRLPSFLLRSFAMNHPLSPFSHLATSSMPSQFRPHHSIAVPHFPRWPPRPSFKLFSYSRWQRERSSISQNAELADHPQSQEAVIEAVGGG